MGYEDLVRGQHLKWGSEHGVGADPIHKVLPVGNVGGFRFRGSAKSPSILALYSSLEDSMWHDFIEKATAKVVYYGDNKKPGNALTATPRRGNIILESVFDFATHNRKLLPPIFLFTNLGAGPNKVFQGLLVPGHESISDEDALVAVWHNGAEGKVLNYRATFTLLDTSIVSGSWIDSIASGAPDADLEPLELALWRKYGQKTL